MTFVFKLSKRKRFLITSFVLSLGFVGVQLLPEQYKFAGIGLHGILSVSLFAWALFDGLGWNATLLTLILPFFYTLGVGFFWFLLPSSIYARIPIVVLYGMGVYALCLTLNIYTVAAIRTIALLRAAKGVGFILTLLTFFLIFDLILSFKWPIYVSSPLVLLASFPLYLQGFWTASLEKKIEVKLLNYSLVASLVMGEMSAVIFFWPATLVVGSLFLTVTAYVLLGLGQSHLEGRLFSQTVREYLMVGWAVLAGMFFVTRWGG
jgi:hypothetical protein